MTCRSAANLLKLVVAFVVAAGMQARDEGGANVNFSWTIDDGTVNYDMHDTPASGGKEKSYKQGRGVPSDEGVLTAEGDGGHGWFFRNSGR